jgi:hypothetical protein
MVSIFSHGTVNHMQTSIGEGADGCIAGKSYIPETDDNANDITSIALAATTSKDTQA